MLSTNNWKYDHIKVSQLVIMPGDSEVKRRCAKQETKDLNVIQAFERVQGSLEMKNI